MGCEMKCEQYNGSISFAAEYAHPLEGVVANAMPTLMGGVVCAAHPLQFGLWIAWRQQETYETHSGYAFYGTWLHRIGLTNADGTLYHDFHHSKNIGNFASLPQDALFGTREGWHEWFSEWLHAHKKKVQ